MPDFKMGNPAKTVISQSGTANPTWGANAPTGTILNVVQNQFNNTRTAGGGSSSKDTFYSFSPAVTCTISNCTTGNKILISCFLHVSVNESNRAIKLRLIDKTNSDAVIGSEGAGGLFGVYQQYINYGGVPVSYEILYTPPSFSSGSFQVELLAAVDDGGETSYLNYVATNNSSREFSSNIILKEIAG